MTAEPGYPDPGRTRDRGAGMEGTLTALPIPPHRLLTVADYSALGEDETGGWELQEGSLVMSPSPSPRHNITSWRLCSQLIPQLPGRLCAIQDVDVDLGLSPPDQPGWVRRPDLVVVAREAVDRVEVSGGLLHATDASLVVEIVSSGSRRTDRVIKRGEYAEAGIPHYWVVDLDLPVSLLVHRRSGDVGYDDHGEVTGTVTLTEPFGVRIVLDDLV